MAKIESLNNFQLIFAFQEWGYIKKYLSKSMYFALLICGGEGWWLGHNWNFQHYWSFFLHDS